MGASSPHLVTQLLVQWSGGDQRALDELVPLVYEELRRQARRQLQRERLGHTLESAALVHEAYARLVDQKRARWENRTQFFAVAAQLMRRILVDYARRRQASKRGGSAVRLTFEAAVVSSPRREVDLLGLDRALENLSQMDPQQGRIVELRFFGGLSIEETAQALGISRATVKRDWAVAKAWLHRALQGEATP